MLSRLFLYDQRVHHYQSKMQSKMRAIQIDFSTGTGRLIACDVDLPQPNAGEVRLRVAYAGINRADVFQVAATYPAPVETNNIPGLEVSGVIDALGEGVTDWQVGDAACALLTGGGYAEFCVCDAQLLAPVPAGFDLKQAAALPEALMTNWLALVRLGEVQAGDYVLLSGGSSGIGTCAISMLKTLNAHPIALAGSPEKIAACTSLGAITLDYRTANLAEQVTQHIQGGSVAIVLDMLGGDFIDLATKLLKVDGKLITIACLNGPHTAINTGRLLIKNLHWHGMTLRSQSLEVKAALWQEVQQFLWPEMALGRLNPVLDHVFPLKEAKKAHLRMQQRLHIGKILLEVSP
ncbi:MAG: NAD(P)H-quinone oxidoreductase [Rickettsiales bacterium]|nr:NAD(P)H-quinone oxidoreductase [Rickettsiales bacterium]